MKKRTFDRMVKLVHQVNDGPLSTPVIFKRLSENQTSFNPLLMEWSGEKNWEIVGEANAIFSAFKESEEWKENGMLNIHDYKITVNDTIKIDANCIVEKKETGELFEIVFIREYIGELVVGLRPRVS